MPTPVEKLTLFPVEGGDRIGVGICPMCSDLHLGAVVTVPKRVQFFDGGVVAVQLRMTRAQALELANQILHRAGSIA